MKATFESSVNLLVTAYIKNELKHGKCTACAIANLLKPTCKELGIWEGRWVNAFSTDSDGQHEAQQGQLIVERQSFLGVGLCIMEITDLPIELQEQADSILNDLKILFEKGPYSKQESMRIEYTFEMADKGNNDDDWMFNGLMAVVSVLAEIHNVSLEAKESAKLLFVKL